MVSLTPTIQHPHPWSSEELVQLIHAADHLNHDWEKISNEVIGGRSAQECAEKYNEFNNETQNNVFSFDPLEDRLLAFSIREYGFNWELIASKSFTNSRSAEDCRKRYEQKPERFVILIADIDRSKTLHTRNPLTHKPSSLFVDRAPSSNEKNGPAVNFVHRESESITLGTALLPSRRTSAPFSPIGFTPNEAPNPLELEDLSSRTEYPIPPMECDLFLDIPQQESPKELLMPQAQDQLPSKPDAVILASPTEKEPTPNCAQPIENATTDALKSPPVAESNSQDAVSTPPPEPSQSPEQEESSEQVISTRRKIIHKKNIWTEEEDRLLIELAIKMDRQWSKICKNFEYHGRVECLNRFRKLETQKPSSISSIKKINLPVVVIESFQPSEDESSETITLTPSSPLSPLTENTPHSRIVYPWSDQELKTLKLLVAKNTPQKIIQTCLPKRTLTAIQRKIHLLKVSNKLKLSDNESLPPENPPQILPSFKEFIDNLSKPQRSSSNGLDSLVLAANFLNT